MAATRLIALHINKGKTVAQCLADRTDYAQNPEKTAKVVVPDYQLSLAIGKEGQNARLAARLTGF